MISTLRYESPIGELCVAERDGYIIGLWMEGQNYDKSEFTKGETVRETHELGQVREWLDGYFKGENPRVGGLRLSLCLCSSVFQKKVLDVVRGIPYGTLLTYGDVARELSAGNGGRGMGAQAVGRALGRNPLSIIVPCHRVIGSQGKLTGYAGGLERKAWLLRHEGAACLCHY